MDSPDIFKEPMVWIVVLHWRGLELTRACLFSLRKLRYKNVRTLVVDNGSKDHDGQSLKNAFPEISLLRLEDNQGFAGGSNRGLEYSLEQNADFIWLINNDAQVAPDSLSILVKEAENSPNVAALGGLIVDSLSATEKKVVSGHGFIDFFKAKTKVSSESTQKSTQCGWLSGSNLLLRAAVLKQVGMFDERYYLYFEDAELCHRMCVNGWHCLFVPTAEIEHVGNASTQGKRKHWRSYYYIRNRFLFFETYSSGANKLPAVLSMFAHLLRHAVVLPFRGEDGRDQLRAELLGLRDYVERRFGKATCLDWCDQ